MDEDNRFKDRKISSVRAAVTSFQGKFGEGKPTEPKHSNARELHHSRKEEAESSLFEAKKTVKDLTRRIEESNSRTKSQAQNSEKQRISKHREFEDSRVEKAMIELEAMKRELSKVKLGMASILEDKRRAEEEAESSKTKALSYKGSIEKLTREIEQVDEENVLVELARIEAVKEREEIELQRRGEAEKHIAEIEEIRKKNMTLVEEIKSAKETEEKLAITLSDINVLEKELRLVKECEKGHESNEESKLESLMRETEATKKKLASVHEERFQFMASMDAIRNEILHVVEETAKSKKREEKAETTIRDLNAKLLRAKSKLESTSASAEKAKSIVSNLNLTFEQLRSETESARKEHHEVIEEAATIEQRVKETEANVDVAEEKAEAALQELKAVKSSEGAALEKLRARIEKTVKNRSLMSSSKITISKFEYDYLKGHASEATEIADKKVEALQAWVEALRASEREILVRTDFLRRQSREDKAEKEADEGLMNSNALLDAEDDFEKWIRQKMGPEDEDGNETRVDRRSKAASSSSRERKARRFSSPVIRGTPRTGSFAVRRRKR